MDVVRRLADAVCQEPAAAPGPQEASYCLAQGHGLPERLGYALDSGLQ